MASSEYQLMKMVKIKPHATEHKPACCYSWRYNWK